MKRKENRSEILDQVYQISKMGMEASEIILPKIKDQELKSQIMRQSGTYTDAMRQTQTMMQKLQKRPGDIRPAAKQALRSFFQIGSNFRHGSEHIAGMMIAGANAGISTLVKVLNESPDEAPEIRWFAERYIDSEERNIDSMQKFL